MYLVVFLTTLLFFTKNSRADYNIPTKLDYKLSFKGPFGEIPVAHHYKTEGGMLFRVLKIDSHTIYRYFLFKKLS